MFAQSRLSHQCIGLTMGQGLIYGGQPVANWMVVDVVCVKPDDFLHLAAERMVVHRVGGLPVLDDEGNLVGMLTERDICGEVVLGGGRIDGARVRDAMTTPVVAVQSEETMYGVAQRMRDNKFRRIPVLVGERLVGIISQTDFLRKMPELIVEHRW